MMAKWTVYDSISVTRLCEIKKLALRRGTWFNVLNRTERGVLDLTMRYVDRIRSAKLAKVVTAILMKLKLAMESVIERMVRLVGCCLAQKISRLAASWGNLSASSWNGDKSFVRYLAIIQMNTSGLLKI